MIRAELEKIVVDLTNKKGIVSIEDLMSATNVSKATMRRYINALDEEKQIVKIRGGAKAISADDASEDEPSLTTKTLLFREEKCRIAHAAKAFISPGDRIMLDSGSTTLELAKAIDKDFSGTVITNDIRIAMALGEHSHLDMLLVGGMIRKGFYSSYSYFAESMLNDLIIDKLFFSVDAVSPDLNLMSYTIDDINLKKICIAKANERILLCDHSKFSAKARFVFEKIDMLDTIIVDDGLPPEIQRKLRQLGKNLLTV